MNNGTEQPEQDAAGKFHTVQPLRDLQSNWGVDLAKNLEDYLLKICSGEIDSSSQDLPHFSINFAEAALLLQGSVQVYSRKVEYLYSLVLHALEFISQKSSQEGETSGSSQPGKDVSHSLHDEENDSFWGLDDIPAEPKNLLDLSNSKGAPADLVRPPANLVVLEGDCLDTAGDAGELESYLLATTDLYQDFLLLDPSDAAAVNDFLNRHYKAGKYQKNVCRSGSMSNKSGKSFLSPTGRSGGTTSKSASRKTPDAHVDQPAAANNDFESRQCNDGFCSPAYDEGNDDHMENGYPDLTDSDDPDNVDPWKPLNPHEPGNLKVKPYKRVKANRMSRVNSKKRHPIMVEFPLARVDGPISVELTNAWEERCALKRQGKPESPSLYEKLRQSLAGKSTKDGEAFSNFRDSEYNGYDSEEPEIDPPDFDMPENIYANDDMPREDKDDGVNVHWDANEVHEDESSHACLEDLCRSHLDSLLASLAETEKQTEMASRVSNWKQRIEQNLEEQESHPPFDIHEYGERVLGKLCKEGDSRNSMSFANVVEGQEKHDIARTFSALLQLVNNGDVGLDSNMSIAESFCYTAENPFYVRLLRNEKVSSELPPQLSKKRAKSPKGFNRGAKLKLGKENRPVADVSPAAFPSPFRFSVKLSKPGVTKCTPEGKKRRKSRYVEPLNLLSLG